MTAVRKAFEAHFHNRDQVSDYVKDALYIVAEHELEGEAAIAVLVKAIDLLAQKQVGWEQIAPAGVVFGNGPLQG